MKKPLVNVDRIIEGDCIDVLNGFPEKTIDAIFADPPYNLQLSQVLYRPNMTKVDAVDDDWDKFGTFAEYDEFTTNWLRACKRVLKETGTIWVIGSYHNIYRVGKIMMDLGYWILNDIIWVKTNPMPNFRGVRFTNSHETLIWAQKAKGSKYTFNHQAMKSLNEDLQMRSDWEIPLCTGNERIRINGEKAHTTQKPEAILYRVLLSSTNVGDVILDPFFGSGTTGAVAKKLKRHWIGIEKEKKYIEIAQRRIDALPNPLISDELFVSNTKKPRPRIPFGALLENGLLEIGQKLYFGKKKGIIAKILANGSIKHKDIVGSIHSVGSEIMKAPCNGWVHWYYLNAKSNELVLIDELRDKMEKIRNK